MQKSVTDTLWLKHCAMLGHGTTESFAAAGLQPVAIAAEGASGSPKIRVERRARRERERKRRCVWSLRLMISCHTYYEKSVERIVLSRAYCGGALLRGRLELRPTRSLADLAEEVAEQLIGPHVAMVDHPKPSHALVDNQQQPRHHSDLRCFLFGNNKPGQRELGKRTMADNMTRSVGAGRRRRSSNASTATSTSMSSTVTAVNDHHRSIETTTDRDFAEPMTVAEVVSRLQHELNIDKYVQCPFGRVHYILSHSTANTVK
eukprot:SAG31_NODE_4512_length_3176_cov_2.548261_2_plen_261_part_00